MFGIGGYPGGMGILGMPAARGKFQLPTGPPQASSAFLQNFMQRARMRRLGAAQTRAMPPQGMMGPGTDGQSYQGQGGGRIAAGLKKFGMQEGM